VGPTYSVGTGINFPRDEAGLETDLSPPSGSEVKISWSYIFTSSYFFTV